MERISSAPQFDSFLSAHPRAIVKYYTDWCPDCRRIERAYSDHAAESAVGGVAYAEVNADQVPEVADRFDVRGIPSFLVFADGQQVDRLYSRDAKTIAQVLGFVNGAEQGLTGHSGAA